MRIGRGIGRWWIRFWDKWVWGWYLGILVVSKDYKYRFWVFWMKVMVKVIKSNEEIVEELEGEEKRIIDII